MITAATYLVLYLEKEGFIIIVPYLHLEYKLPFPYHLYLLHVDFLCMHLSHFLKHVFKNKFLNAFASPIFM